MKQWFNLFIHVAKPILTDLAYTGTNIFLDTIQAEFKKQWSKQNKVILNSDYIDEQLKQDRVSQRIDTKTLLPSQSQFAQSELLLEIAKQTQETKLKLPEINKSLEYWPLRILPSQLIQSSRERHQIPLKIFLAPAQKIGIEFQQLGIESEEVERVLSQSLREFLSRNYPLCSSVKPTEFLGSAWNSNNFYGEASIKVLFGVLQAEPTLILETAIEGSYLIFRFAYWGGEQEKYCYETIFKLPYRMLIEASVKARALNWKETRKKLIDLGKTPEEVATLGGDNETNLSILEEVERLQNANIDTQLLNFSYQVNRQDFEHLCQFLSIYQCLIVGWITDIHYLIYDDISPHISEWLPQLEASMPKPEFLQAVTYATVSLYQGVLTTLTRERPHYVPRLSLKLAQSLIDLDSSLARKQVESSWHNWLQQRQIYSLETIERLETIKITMTAEDWEYFASLKTCLSLLGEEASNLPQQELLDALSERMQILLGQTKAHFALDYTIAEIPGQLFCLSLDATSCKLIDASDKGILALWQLKRRKVQLAPTYKLKGNTGKAIAVTLSPDGQILASSDTTSKRSYIRIWNLHTGKLERTLFGHKQVIHSLGISSGDRSFLASGSHKIKLWDLKTGEPWLTLFGHKQWVYSLAIAADGQTLASGSKDKTVRIWHLPTGNLLRTLAGHQEAVKVVAITPDGKMLVSGSEDQTIKLWEIETGKLLRTLTGHSGGVSVLTISPDCQYLFSGSQDKTIKIWHLQTGELRQTLFGHEQAIRALAIHPNGQTIASGSEDKTIKFWRIL